MKAMKVTKRTERVRKKVVEGKPTLNPKLKEFWRVPARNRILTGGRSSSKSWDAAGFAIFLTNRYKLRFLCARQIQNKMEQSVYALLITQIYRFGLQRNFDIQRNKIISKVTGSEFMFYGLSRNIDEIKSLEGIDVCWLEEAHNLTKAQWEILEPTVRKDFSQFWILFNPDLSSDFVYQYFVVNTPNDTVVQHINYEDNEFISDTALNVALELKERNIDEYNHIYLGEVKSDDDLSIIKRSWISAAIDAHLILGFEPSGANTLGYDIADAGEDKNATAYSHGSVLLAIEEWQGGEDELLKSCTRAYGTAKDFKAKIIYDSIGVGAGGGAKFEELNKHPDNLNIPNVEHAKFVAGAGVVDPEKEYSLDKLNGDMFSNLKAQAWWDVRRRLMNTKDAIDNGTVYNSSDLISISSDIDEVYLDQLKNELSTPRQDRDSAGKVKVESKKDLAKRGIASPNIADAAIMSWSPHLVKRKKANMFDV